MSLIESVLLEYDVIPPDHDDDDKWIKICCPLHSETRPSFAFNPSLNAWNCFVCGGGKPVHFIMRKEGYGYRDAVKRLEEIAAEYGDDLCEATVRVKPWETVSSGTRIDRRNNRPVRPWDR